MKSYDSPKKFRQVKNLYNLYFSDLSGKAIYKKSPGGKPELDILLNMQTQINSFIFTTHADFLKPLPNSWKALVLPVLQSH